MSRKTEAAAEAVEEKYPGLSRVITACLVGWEGFDGHAIIIPPVMYHGLMVKIGEWLDER